MIGFCKTCRVVRPLHLVQCRDCFNGRIAFEAEITRVLTAFSKIGG